ncbi:MAG TPA: 50S ribosomal protein L4 [Candidatus Latescibacteria bacterium]|nr:50S ribosomal protein L4 [Candidatus Latescibacterota bacterium]
MIQAKAFSAFGYTSEPVPLPESIFGVQPAEHAVYQTVKAYLANQRQGTASTKTRGEVQGSGRKIWRQKGTGRARHGSVTAPIFVGGGVAFGPKPRSYKEKVPKKVRRLALKSALSAKARDGTVVVVDDPILEEPKTKQMVTLLRACGLEGRKVLFTTGEHSEILYKSCRNIPDLRFRYAENLCAYDVVWADVVVFTKSGLAKAEEVFGDEGPVPDR